MYFAAKQCSLNESQYRSKQGHLCHSAMLNKILTFDFLRLTKKGGSYVEFDATANYDCMIPALVPLACSRMGLGSAPGENSS